MASRIIEFFGYAPQDKSPEASNARQEKLCPFLNKTCTKTLNDGAISGACTLQSASGTKVICCPNRLYDENYKILREVSEIAFGADFKLVSADGLSSDTGECVAVFGKGWGKELRLPNRGRSGGYFVDWVLAHISDEGELISFVAVEVQSIDTTGNYRDERIAYLEDKNFSGNSTAGFNWENVNKRILPQIIYKGHVLRQEPLCQKGLFFVCPTPVYNKISERLGGDLRTYPIQPGSLTILWYDVESGDSSGHSRTLVKDGEFTTTIDQVAMAFTSPKNLPPARVYEDAIREFLI